MPTKIRRERLESFIKEELSSFLLVNELEPLAKRATFTDVRLTDDLSHAKIYVDTVERAKVGEVVAALERCGPQLRAHVAGKLTTRRCPQLHFVADESVDNAMRIDAILKKVVK